MKKFIFIVFVCSLLCGCVVTDIEEIKMEDYGVFDFASDIHIFKATSDGMIDSTDYYATTSTDSFGKTTTTINKTGWARMTSKSEVQKDCLKSACKQSHELGFEYIVILKIIDDTYQDWSDIRYKYQIIFIPIHKEQITQELRKYTIYRNSLYYTDAKKEVAHTTTLIEQEKSIATNKNSYKKIDDTKFEVTIGEKKYVYTCTYVDWKSDGSYETDNYVVKEILNNIVSENNINLNEEVKKATLELGYNTCYTITDDGKIIVNSYIFKTKQWILAE